MRVHSADAALRSAHVDSNQSEGRTCARSAYANPEWIVLDHNCVIDLKERHRSFLVGKKRVKRENY